jgi:hypothetical protein
MKSIAKASRVNTALQVIQHMIAGMTMDRAATYHAIAQLPMNLAGEA